MATGVINPFLLTTLLEVSPIKAGQVAGKLIYKYADQYAKAPSPTNLFKLNKKTAQADRIKDMFSKRKISAKGFNGKESSRNLGDAFNEHTKLALKKAKHAAYKPPKVPQPNPIIKAKKSWKNLDRHEKILVGLLGGSILASTAVGAADIYAESKSHKKREKK